MDNNWIVENLTNAFGVWNSKMTEMWSLLTESPQTFKGGTIWQTIVTINGGMQAIGYSTLEIVEGFERATGVKLPWEYAPRREGDIEAIWGNVDKANKVLGCQHRPSSSSPNMRL